TSGTTSTAKACRWSTFTSPATANAFAASAARLAARECPRTPAPSRRSSPRSAWPIRQSAPAARRTRKAPTSCRYSAPWATCNMAALVPLRVAVVGHVDHGKSTLIGRLFYEAGAVEAGRLPADNEWAFLIDQFQEERERSMTLTRRRRSSPPASAP